MEVTIQKLILSYKSRPHFGMVMSSREAKKLSDLPTWHCISYRKEVVVPRAEGKFFPLRIAHCKLEDKPLHIRVL